MYRVANYVKRTDTGRRRSGNEDSAYVRVPLFVVADGMGGAQAGEVASRLTTEAFAAGMGSDGASDEERLAALVAAANERVHAAAVADERLTGMGTTCTAAYLGPDELAIAHVGDSRAYRRRGGVLTQITEDHSLVGELVRRGQITEQEAEDHPQRSIITRALGPEPQVPVDHHSRRVEDGDLYMLCSDGLTDMVPDREIASILAREDSLEERGDALVAAATAAGGRDNITVILFEVEQVAGIAEPAQATETIEGAAIGAAVAAAGSAPLTGDGPEPEPRKMRLPAHERQPAPAAGPGARGRSRVRGPLIALLVTLLVVGVIGSAGWMASRSVFFIGVDGQGFVTLYKGLPYDVAGIALYQQEYVSGLPASQLDAGGRATVTDHSLRPQQDAVDLIRKLEQGQVERPR